MTRPQDSDHSGERALAELAAELAEQRRALAALEREPALLAGDPGPALARLAEAAARRLRVDRAGVWRLRRPVGDDARAERIAPPGPTITPAPSLLAALARADALAITDTRRDPRLGALLAAAAPHAVAAVLLAPAILGGAPAGFVCFEHDGGPRRWRPRDALLAGLVADAAARLLAAADEAHLRELATRDALTGLHNRRSLAEVGLAEIERARRHGARLSAAMIDIDHFKRINDTRGHAAGDAVLRAVAACLRAGLRASDICGRWGGEEFVVLLPETDSSAALRVLERTRERIVATPFSAGEGEPERVSISAGVAEWSAGESLDALIDRADRACYAAKRAGRDRTALAAPSP